MFDLIIIGGGAAGMLSAINAKKRGIENVLVIEKNPFLGGSLNSADFNISEKESLTGQEYLKSLLAEYEALNIKTRLNTMVLNINDAGNIICLSPEHGVEELTAKNIIISNGGKEKGKSALNITGDRCAGVMTLLNAKNVLSIENVIPGKEIVIVGTENLHMIFNSLKNRQIKIKAIVGTNIPKQIEDFSINTYENYTLKSILGKDRVSSIIITNDVEDKEINCDTVVLALGMLADGVVAMRSNIVLNPATTGPKVDENLETSRKSIFACGNGIYIHRSIEELENESSKLINYIVSL